MFKKKHPEAGQGVKPPHKSKTKFIFSLSLKTTFAVIVFVFLLVRASLKISTDVHSTMMVYNNMSRDYQLSRTYSVNLDQEIVTGILEEGLQIYESIPEEQRKNPTDETYLAHFDVLKTPEYDALRDQLKKLAAETGARWIDFRLVDEENQRIIFLMDSEERTDDKFRCGYWVDITTAEDTYTFDKSVWPIMDDSDDDSYSETEIDRIIEEIVRALSAKAIQRYSVYAPFYHPETGETIGYIGIGEEMKTIERDSLIFLAVFGVIFGFSIVFLVLVTIFVVQFVMVRPLKRLTKAAVQYGKTGGQDSHIFAKTKIRSHDEIRVLWESMTDMEESISQHMRNLTAVTAENQRIETELDLGAGIQRSMLPYELTGFTGEKNFDISASIRPAREVGGDFYDYFVIDPDHIGICIADVSGKGVPASLFMVVARTLIKNTAKKELSASAVMEHVNREICENNPELMFVTVFFGIYTVSERSFTYINAGHEDPAIYREEKGCYELLIEEHDPMIGFDETLSFTERKLLLAPGDKLFLYTDGIPESTDPSDTLYGTERMIRCLNGNLSLQGNDVLSAVSADAISYAKGAPQFDDMTMLLLEIHQI